MSILWTNNAASVLTGDITAGTLSITVTTGHGDRFPEVAAPHYFMATLVDTSGNREIVKVTARTSGSNTMTITRAQEGTSARSFATGSVVELRITKNAMDLFSRSVDIHENHYVADASAADQGATTNSSSLKSLVDALGATEEATIDLPHTDTGDTTTYTVGTNLTIPATVTLRAHKGVRISPSAGVTLTVNGIVQAGAFQIFAGDGTVTVSTYPQDQAWWGSTQRLDVTGLKIGTAEVSSFAKTILDDANADAALTTLGVSAYGKTLIDDANADTALSTLGVSAAAKTILDDASVTAILETLIASSAQGDLLARGASVWARMAKGTANQKLFMNAAADGQEWASGIKIGVTSHDVSATGTQAVTGVGFKPNAVIFLASVSGGSRCSIGFDNSSANVCLYNMSAVTAGRWDTMSNYSIELYGSVGNETFAKITSLDSDGFTLTWSKNGSPTGTASIYYLAFR